MIEKKQLKIGLDLTEILCIRKHDPEAKTEKQLLNLKKHSKIYKHMLRYKWFRKLVTKKKTNWPKFLRKTDEERIQNCPSILRKHQYHEFYRTEKMDGQSATYAVNNVRWWWIFTKKEYYICSRNIHLKQPDSSNYWNIYKNKNIKAKLDKLHNNFAIQGEICGPGIQSNKYNLKELEFYTFSIYNINKESYVNFYDFSDYCAKLGLKTVPILNSIPLPNTVSDIVEESMQKSTVNPNVWQEGQVWRKVMDSSVSFKTINPNFLLKYSH